MWALTEAYHNWLSSFLDKGGQNGEFSWFVNLAGSDLPWESAEDLPSMDKRSTSLTGTGSLTDSTSCGTRSVVDSHADEVGNLGLGIASNAALDKWLDMEPSVERVQPLRSMSSNLCPGPPGKAAVIARKRLKVDKNSACLLGLGCWAYTSIQSIGMGSLAAKKAPRRVTFSSTAQCVLIPSRGDLMQQKLGELLWFSEADLEAAKKEGQAELQLTLASNSSNLSLYAAMSLLYRPCSMKGIKRPCDHFRILIVDDSTVARRMVIHNIVTGHRLSGAQEHLYVHQAVSLPTAMDSIHMHTYNLICVDQYLNGDADREHGDGATIIKQARKQFDNCIIIAMSAALDVPGESTELGRKTYRNMMDAGADVIFRKPLPVDLWQQLVQLLPIEF